MVIEELESSSSETVNQLVYEIAGTILKEPGLKSLRVLDYRDMNNLEQWPLQ